MPKDMNIDPFIHSVRLDLDWETHDQRMSEALEELFNAVTIKGNTYKIRKHLRALLIICARLCRDFPDYYVAYSRSNSFDCKATHSNPMGLKMRSMKKIVDALSPAYLDHRKGYNWFANQESRLSRLRPNNRLIDLINKHRLVDIHYRRVLIRGGIILKNKAGVIVHDYPDTEDTRQMREDLSAYNDCIERTQLSVKEYEGFKHSIYESNRSYRVFNGDFTCGGRFYGGWWQLLKKKQRRDILINGTSVVELDFKSNHLCFLYGLEDVPMPEMKDGDLYNIVPDIPRKLFKQIIMLSLNTRSSNGAWAATRNFMAGLDGRKKELWDKHIRNKQAYDQIVALIKEAHPVVDGYFYSFYGSKLMNMDSRVANYIMAAMTEKNIPCLSIHDSFIVQEDKEEELRKAMHEAYDFIGYPMALPTIEKV